MLNPQSDKTFATFFSKLDIYFKNKFTLLLVSYVETYIALVSNQRKSKKLSQLV